MSQSQIVIKKRRKSDPKSLEFLNKGMFQFNYDSQTGKQVMVDHIDLATGPEFHSNQNSKTAANNTNISYTSLKPEYSDIHENDINVISHRINAAKLSQIRSKSV